MKPSCAANDEAVRVAESAVVAELRVAPALAAEEDWGHSEFYYGDPSKENAE